MTNKNKVGKSRYALRVQKRKRLSGNRSYETLNNGQIKKLPIPLPLFANIGEE